MPDTRSALTSQWIGNIVMADSNCCSHFKGLDQNIEDVMLWLFSCWWLEKRTELKRQ